MSSQTTEPPTVKVSTLINKSNAAFVLLKDKIVKRNVACNNKNKYQENIYKMKSKGANVSAVMTTKLSELKTKYTTSKESVVTARTALTVAKNALRTRQSDVSKLIDSWNDELFQIKSSLVDNVVECKEKRDDKRDADSEIKDSQGFDIDADTSAIQTNIDTIDNELEVLEGTKSDLIATRKKLDNYLIKYKNEIKMIDAHISSLTNDLSNDTVKTHMDCGDEEDDDEDEDDEECDDDDVSDIDTDIDSDVEVDDYCMQKVKKCKSSKKPQLCMVEQLLNNTIFENLLSMVNTNNQTCSSVSADNKSSSILNLCLNGVVQTVDSIIETFPCGKRKNELIKLRKNIKQAIRIAAQM